MKKALTVGVAGYEDMKARMMAVARGEQPLSKDEPTVWLTSPESLAKALSTGNPALLELIAEQYLSGTDG